MTSDDLPEPPPLSDDDAWGSPIPIEHGRTLSAGRIHDSGIAGVATILREPARRQVVLDDPAPIRYNEMTAAYEHGDREIDIDFFIADFRLRTAERVLIGKGDRERPVRFSVDSVASALTAVGMAARYHPVRDYLKQLAPTSGIIDQVASDVLHMGEEDHLGRSMLRMWAIGCVRRIFEPGCKVDNVLVLEGPKGHRKSTFFQVMAVRPEWFGDSAMDIENVKSIEVLHSAWIYEWQEMLPVRNKPLTVVQSFLTTQADRYIRPYGRGQVRRERSVVVVGTTNNAQFLPEAERRFWAHKITQVIDTDLAITLREQFWGEAVALHLAGEPHQFAVDDDLGTQLIAQQVAFTAEHPWQQDVTKWLATNPTEITTRNALTAAGFGLQKPPTRREDNDMSDLLKALGLCRDDHPSTLSDGSRSRLWRTTPQLTT